MNKVKKELRLKLTTSVTDDLPQDLPHMIGIVVLKQQDGKVIFLFHFFSLIARKSPTCKYLQDFQKL